MEIFSSMSVRERNLWGDMLLHIIVAVYFFPKMFALISAGHAGLLAGAVKLVVTCIIISVVLAVVANVVLAILKVDVKPQPRDEREKGFLTRSYLIAYSIVSIGVFAVMAGIMMSEGNSDTALGVVGTMQVLQWLWALLVVASISRSGTQLFYYRRGY